MVGLLIPLITIPLYFEIGSPQLIEGLPGQTSAAQGHGGSGDLPPIGELVDQLRERGYDVASLHGMAGADQPLEILLITSDFSIEYVASNTNLDLPFFYKMVALWAGHSGSLLLWTWIITICAALVEDSL